MFKYKRVECPELVEGQYCFYILECIDHSLYCGSSSNLGNRLKDHSIGKAAIWTKVRRPVQLVYFEIYASMLQAHRRELQVKGWVRSKKENPIFGRWTKISLE